MNGTDHYSKFPMVANCRDPLENGEYEYYNTRTEQNEIHEANNIGISNTPFFVNLSIGYTISIRNYNHR